MNPQPEEPIMADEYRPKAEHFKGQKLPFPAKQSDMNQQPDSDLSNYRPAGKLDGKVALITGGDSGIGRAVAIAFAMEGAKVAVLYNENDGDARTTQDMIEGKGGECLLLRRDVRSMGDCTAAVDETVATFGTLDILVNNAAFQMAVKDFDDLTEEQFRRTLETNILGCFRMIKAALPHLSEGASIINTGSIVGKVGHPMLVDYTASKGAIHAFTKSLAIQFGERGIRVNAVLPGPVWTPAIPGTMPIEEVENFGHEVALGRPGQPEELAPAFVFFASSDGSFTTGSLLEVTGGKLG
jgi:NAD(P)-dependent dehydrogenase (short-subunit alcohol dehydrogenase family)